jgi:exopolysaccharide biosynthesis protein
VILKILKRGSLSISAFNDNRHLRTAAFITHKNEFILLTAEAEGLNLPELTTLMLNLNFKTAVNLDGGSFTTLYIDGKGVVNMPCTTKNLATKENGK